MRKKGFTLIEMLAVIAVLGLLVLLVLPNVLKNYRDAKKISFINEAKEVYSAATDLYVTQRTKGNKVGLIETGGRNELSISNASDLNYTIRLDSDGKVTAFKLSNAEYCIVGVGDFLGKYTKEDIIELSDEEAAQQCEVSADQDGQKFILRLQNKGAVKTDYNPKIIYLKYNVGWYSDNNLHKPLEKNGAGYSVVTKPTKDNYYYEGAFVQKGDIEIKAINCDGTVAQSADGGGIFTGKEEKPYVEAFSSFIRKHYTVVFNGGTDSTGSMTSVTCDYEKTNCKIPSNVDTNGYGKEIKKTGYLFKGWTSSIGEYDATKVDLPVVTDANENDYPSLKFDNEKVCSGEQDIDNKITFTAKWEPIKYQIAYNCNGGSGTMDNTEHTYNASANLRTNACTRNGYSFTGWSKTSTGTAEFNNNASVKNLTDQNNAVVTLYAVWSACGPGQYLAGNTCTPCQKNYYSTGTANAACTKCPDGYTTTGTGSNSKASCTINCEANYRVAAVDAKCTTKCADGYNLGAHSVKAGDTSASCGANTYYVKYNGNSSTGGTMANSTHTYGTAKNLTANSYTKTGNKFDGWAESASGAVKYADKASVKDLTKTNGGTFNLYAKWSACGKGYYLNGNTCTACAKGYYSTGSANAECTKCPDGYTTDGTGSQAKTACKISCEANYRVAAADAKCTTACDKGKHIGAHTIIAGNTSAACSANTYYVKYNGNGNTGGSMTNSTHTYGTAKALTANAFTKTGYTFAGWAESADGSVVYSNKASVNNLTETNGATVNLYAKWTPITFTVAYNRNTGTGTMSNQTCTYDQDCKLAANGFTKSGNGFAGWKKNNSGTALAAGTNIKNASSTSTTITYYAQWSACGKGYYLSNGVCEACPKGYYSTGTANSECTKCPDGYTTDNTGSQAKTACKITCSAGTRVTQADKTCTGNCSTGYNIGQHTVVAGNTSNSCNANTYYVKYNGNGATSGSMSNSTHTYGTAKNLTANTFTKTNHTFAGWATTTTGNVAYSDQASVNNLTAVNGETINLYAKWNVIEDTTSTVGTAWGTLEQADRQYQGFYHAGWGDGGSQPNTVAAANAGDSDGLKIPLSKVTVCTKGQACSGGGTTPTCWTGSGKTVCNYYAAEKICSHYGFYVLPLEVRLNFNLNTAAENKDMELDYTFYPGVGYAYTLNLCANKNIDLVDYCPDTTTCKGALNNKCQPGYYWGYGGKGGYLTWGYDSHPVFTGLYTAYDKKSAFSVRCVDYDKWDNIVLK